jgi:hypothetical protein
MNIHCLVNTILDLPMHPSTEKNLATPTIAFLEDRIEKKRYLKIRIPQIEPNRYDILPMKNGYPRFYC